MLLILLLTAHIVYFPDRTACCCSIIVFFFFALAGVVNKGIKCQGIHVHIALNGKKWAVYHVWSMLLGLMCRLVFILTDLKVLEVLTVVTWGKE